jgi:uncharacterized membrane protein YcaP (DUF421 family)
MMIALVVVQTLATYLFLVAALATVGRREMAQLSSIDYLIIALLGSAVESGLYAGGGSFWAGLASLVTLLLANRALVSLTARSPRLRRFLVGRPILLVHDGRIVGAELRRSRLTEEELQAAIRLRGYDGVEAVRFAVMEPNGEIGVVPRQVKPSAR